MVVVKLHVLLVKVSSPVSKTSIKAVTFSRSGLLFPNLKNVHTGIRLRVGKKISLQGSFFHPPFCQLCSFSHDSAKDFATVQRNDFH